MACAGTPISSNVFGPLGPCPCPCPAGVFCPILARSEFVLVCPLVCLVCLCGDGPGPPTPLDRVPGAGLGRRIPPLLPPIGARPAYAPSSPAMYDPLVDRGGMPGCGGYPCCCCCCCCGWNPPCCITGVDGEEPVRPPLPPGMLVERGPRE